MHRDRLLIAGEAREGRLHALVEQHAVRQIGQRVMMRHVGDARFGAAPLGNVLIGRDPAAVGHRLMRHREGAAVRQTAEIGAGALLADQDLLLGADHAECEIGVGGALEQVADRRPGLHHVGRKREQVLEAAVADDQALRRIDHAEALRHVVQRRVEPLVLRAQRDVALAQDPVLLLQFGVGVVDRAVRRREVGMGVVEVHMGALQQAIVPDQQHDQRDAADDEADRERREQPVSIISWR